MYWIVRDYVGHVSEDSVRRNFLLIYELLDEVLDYGFPQNSSTERLKQFIAMEPVVVRPRGRSATPASAPSEVVKSVLDTARTGAKEEIFVDVVEKLTAIFDTGGHLRSSSIVGAIKVKSYLGGNPPIRLGLPENLILGQRDTGRNGGDAYGSSSSGSNSSIILDTYSLHEGVDPTVFNRDRILELVPPEGHFDLLTYRCSSSYRPPFRVYPLLEDDAHSPDKMTLFIRIRAEYEATKTASGVEVTVPLPPSVQRVHCETDAAPGEGNSLLGNALPLAMKGMFGQQAEWDAREHRLIWSLKNLKGGKEHVLRVRLTIDSGSVEMAKQEYGPVMVQFVLPGKPSISGMDVNYLKILKDEKGYNPARWFRVVALANSYQIRTG
jgi:AP-4 complex subunit mu-1